MPRALEQIKHCLVTGQQTKKTGTIYDPNKNNPDVDLARPLMSTVYAPSEVFNPESVSSESYRTAQLQWLSMAELMDRVPVRHGVRLQKVTVRREETPFSRPDSCQHYTACRLAAAAGSGSSLLLDDPTSALSVGGRGVDDNARRWAGASWIGADFHCVSMITSGMSIIKMASMEISLLLLKSFCRLIACDLHCTVSTWCHLTVLTCCYAPMSIFL